MTPLKQLFRQPVRLLAIILLVGMAFAFICLSAGVFSSAKATLAQIEERYVTIGIPTTETEGVTTEYNGLTLHHEESIISQDMWAYMDQLAADGRIIKGAYQQKYISAYCPSIQTVTSGNEDGTYAPSLDTPYGRAILVVRITSVDEINLPEFAEIASVSVTASIENVIKLHQDYAVRSTLYLTIGCNSREELDALDIQVGRRYLVYGSEYIDRDLELRTTLAESHRCSVEDIDLSRISYDLTADEKKTASQDFIPVAKYSSGEKTSILGQNMVDAIDSCAMTVTHWHGLYPETQPDYAIDGSETGVLLNDQYLDVYMTPLETGLDVFLSSNAGIEWRSAAQELDTQYHKRMKANGRYAQSRGRGNSRVRKSRREQGRTDRHSLRTMPDLPGLRMKNPPDHSLVHATERLFPLTNADRRNAYGFPRARAAAAKSGEPHPLRRTADCTSFEQR